MPRNQHGTTTIMATPAVRVGGALSLLQMGLHIAAWASSADPRLVAPHAVALLHDLLILGMITLIAVTGSWRLPPKARRVGDILSVLALIVPGLLLSMYPQVLRAHLAFPANLFNASKDSTVVMLNEYLGISRLWPALVVLAVVASALRLPPFTLRYNRVAVVVAALIFAAAALTLPGSPNPWIFSIVQSLSTIASPQVRAVPSLVRPPASGAEIEKRRISLDVPRATGTPEHVFLIVLEGVTAQDFEREFIGNAGGFYSMFRERAIYFRRYYATNLDSYTSLIAMLTGVQVPYRAYASEALYAAVNAASNLTRSLRDAGFHTCFVSTYQYQPFVPTRGDWERILDRSGLPSLEGWVSLGSSRMEAATEDRAALSTIIELAVTHARTFVLHELVYGHSTEWRATTGQTQLAYYDQYLRELASELERRGLFDNSLLVIVSDHGDRGKSSDAENYRVPLLIVGAGVEPTNDADFRSHLDLPELILAVMGRRQMPQARRSQYLVGSSGRWVYGQLWADGSHLFIDDATGAVTAHRGVPDASGVQRSFQLMLNAFGVEFGPVAE
ncbi:sulfatase-like hydrolase/transferase [candidate division KSB1 bacterium]|nr:sulfatase-like hydrolase/transferase [candidate division KSB1 bacterium]